MKRTTILALACAVAILLISSQEASAQVVDPSKPNAAQAIQPYPPPATVYYPSTTYYPYPAGYVGGTYYRPAYARTAYTGRYYGNRYYGNRYYGGRYAYGARGGYRVGFRR